jgi:hypothetical protein
MIGKGEKKEKVLKRRKWLDEMVHSKFLYRLLFNLRLTDFIYVREDMASVTLYKYLNIWYYVVWHHVVC